jgi:putative transposase
LLLHRANVERLELTAEQANTFAQWSGACRYVYNIGWEQRRNWWRPGRKFNYYQQASELTQLRAEVDWLRAVPVHALQNALKDVDTAFQNFFLGLCDFPQPHRKFRHDSFTLSDPKEIGFKRLGKRVGAIKLPKVGWVKCRWHRPLEGTLKSITVKRKAGHWFAAIRRVKEIPDPAPSTLPRVGIDRGVKVFAALSKGDSILPLNAGKRIVEKLAKAQRRLARKVKGSANWRKQKAKIARLHAQAANARKDFLHKQSIAIAKNHGMVKIEKLRVQNMTRSAKGTVENPGKNVAAKSGLNRSILDQGWGMFATMLKYKLAERGGELIEVNAPYTSQKCFPCGYVGAVNRKDQATFVCLQCGHTDNADHNAACVIEWSEDIAHQPPKRTLRRVGKRKHQAEAVNV